MNISCGCGCGVEFDSVKGTNGYTPKCIPGHRPLRSIPDEKSCSRCKEVKPISEYGLRTLQRKSIDQTYQRPREWCKTCEVDSQSSYSQTEKGKEYKRRHKERHRGEIKFHVSERIAQWRCKTPNSDLTVDYLVDLFHQQEGLCHYSGAPLVIGAKGYAQPNSLSLDRVYPEKGYMKGNVVWCTYFINTAKGVLTVDEFLDLLRTILLRVPDNGETTIK